MNPVLRNIILAAIVAAVLAAGLWWFHYMPDDAYIGMRYAGNLAGGDGLVFNPGERVEGYTNFLWVIILAAAAKAQIPLVSGARILSLLCSAGTLLLVWHLCDAVIPAREKKTAGRSIAAAAPLILAASVPFVTWASSGTEIPLFTFLLTAGMLLLTTGRDPLPVFTLFALLTLVRPEGAAYYILAAALLIVRGENPRKVAAGGLLIAALLLGPYLAWKIYYFGGILPNTFYAKTGATAVQLRNGATYTLRFAAWYGWLPAAAVLFMRTGKERGTGSGVSRAKKAGNFGRIIVPLSVIGLNWMIVTVLGGDWMLMYRLLVPCLPAIAVMAAASIPSAAALQRPDRQDRSDWPDRPEDPRVYEGKCRNLSWQSAALAAIFTCVAMAPGSSDYSAFERERLAVKAFGWVGEILGERLPTGTSLGCGSTGAIGFYSGLPIIDILGLTEPEIARKGKIVADQPGHMKTLGSHVLDRKPDLLLLGNIQLHRGRRREDLGRIKIQEKDIILDPRFSTEYIFSNLPMGGGFFLSCYRRSGSPAFSR